jgi:filamentous hemagglutinin family protein
MKKIDLRHRTGHMTRAGIINLATPGNVSCRRLPGPWIVLLALSLSSLNPVLANPTGGTVAQGTATFTSTGPRFTIQASDRAFINWQSFNIGLGQTTTFIQPSSSAVVWNQINDSNPSRILGNLNANGYVVLQNSSGFFIGGQASITAQGLVMTTTPISMPDLTGGGAWQFNAPPPTASIVNYGQINLGRGGSAYLIAQDVENHGAINAPEGNIGLYAGRQVLLSQRPDGRGLSAKVTLPEGSVDNSGSLIADGGTIALHAQVVNQGGLIQANSIRDVNGTIELLAGDAINLAASSSIAAKGDAQGASRGGSVRIKSDRNFTDQLGSIIDISGGVQGGNAGNAEISAASLDSIHSKINGHAVSGFRGGKLLIDPYNLSLTAAFVSSLTPVLNSGLYSIDLQADHDITVATLWNLADPGGPATLSLTAGNNITVNPNSGIKAGNNWSLNLSAGPKNLSSVPDPGTDGIYLNGNSVLETQNGSISLWAANEIVQGGAVRALKGGNISATTEFGNITVDTIWRLADPGGSATLSLTAGNSIILNPGSGIKAGNNWSLNLSASPQTPSALPDPRTDGIYLDGDSYIETQNGDISLRAANEIIVQDGAVRTRNGGNISATAVLGDVNTGNNYFGYIFAPQSSLNNNKPPYYKVDDAHLGGISTAAGGNVSITAGGNVTSYLPTQDDPNSIYCGGTGAFGTLAGNVTIKAGGNVSGNYVLANGMGSITAGGDIGIGGNAINGGFALSLIKGGWSIFAPHGSIYLQDVLNPNGIFNDTYDSNQSDSHGVTIPYTGYHRFDYDPRASVLLNAANSVEITGSGAPLVPATTGGAAMPILLPPSLEVVTGSGGFVLDHDVTLFPSAFGELHITTHDKGNFQSRQDPTNPQDVNYFRLQMSDSGGKQWLGADSFGLGDHAAIPPELNNFNPVEISISGDVKNVNLYTTKATHMTVGGDMSNSGFVGENLHSSPTFSDVTYVKVTGKISYSPIYAFGPNLSAPIVGADPLHPSDWTSIFSLLVNNDSTAAFAVSPNSTPATLLALANALRVFHGTLDPTAPEGFVYDAKTLSFGYRYQMSTDIRGALEGFSTIHDWNGTLRIIKLDALGNPVLQAGQKSLGQDPAKFYFATTTVSFVPKNVVENLYVLSRNSVKDAGSLSPGFQIGGPGEFDITAASMNLGASHGILSWGRGDGTTAAGGINYGPLARSTSSGAAVNVTVDGDIGMLTSTIASFDGGKVSVTSTFGEIDLGLASLPMHPSDKGNVAYGIYTSGHSDVTVQANKNINIETARIAAFNGGTVRVKSLTGNVNAGNGANQTLVVPIIYVDWRTGRLISDTMKDPKPYGSGILALAPSSQYLPRGAKGLPGDIFVDTPQGDIISTLGGISQYALNGSIEGGPTITLNAGTPASGGQPAIKGNVLLGAGGVVGGTVNITAQGNIEGLIVSRQNSSINAAQNFSGTVLSGGTANLAAGGTVAGSVIGIGGVNASAGQGVTADVLGQNVSINGGASQSTLGATAAASSSSQSAAQQSTTEAHEQVAATTTDGDANKKKAKGPVLAKRTGRVTVILPSKS